MTFGRFWHIMRNIIQFVRHPSFSTSFLPLDGFCMTLSPETAAKSRVKALRAARKFPDLCGLS
jgi:hypothetical protein